ncbi:MAG: RNA polymerase sigma factor [Pseudomonadota bacterium]
MIEKRGLKHDKRAETPVALVFVENFSLLKRFLGRFFSERQDIEDVAQEAFLRAYVAEQRKSIEQPKAFLFRIAKNLALTKLERKSRQIACYLDESGNYVCESGDYLGLEMEGTAYAEIEAVELLGIYCDAVASLPEKCRQVFLLRKVHGLGHREIAERMSLSVSSVEKYLLKGVVMCRDFMEKKGIVSEFRATESGLQRGKR